MSNQSTFPRVSPSVSLPRFRCAAADLIDRQGVEALSDAASALPALTELIEAYALEAGNELSPSMAHGLAVILGMIDAKMQAAQGSVYQLTDRSLAKFMEQEKGAEDAE